MWNPHKGLDYEYADQVSGENLFIGGVGTLLHKYIGVEGGEEDVTDIQDFLFLENRDRNYDDTVYEVRGFYTPEDVDYDLTQFGIFLSSDTLRFTFHYNDMIRLLGRKIMAGDIIELPNKRDVTLEGGWVNDYYVVQDALFSAPGYSFTWRPHLWKVRAKKMPAAPEFQDILDKAATGDTAGAEGEGTGLMPPGYSETVDADGNPGFGTNRDLIDSLNRYCKILGITDEIIQEAEDNVCFDPKYFETAHLWITLDENDYPCVEYWAGGDGVPPNGAPLVGMGTQFPEDMNDGEYFLRLDFEPDRLFQKQGNCYVRIEDDLRKVWTAYNRRLDTYIDNINETVLDDGTTVREKQSISEVIPQREDLNAEKKQEIKDNEEKRSRIAKKLDGAE
jgi:hypothetical protein